MKKEMISKITSGALLCTMLAYTSPILAYSKDETVYSKLDVSGKRYSTIVNNHLINVSGENLINDLSDLFNIKNVNGNEEFTKDGNNLIWNSKGSDIYYQGESQKELPIDCTVKYFLNDEEISANEIAGKSGNIKIIIEYKNKDEHIVNINGKNETLYTPFVAVCGTIINNEKNKNINISNGKIVDDGSKTIAIGIAMPGFQESLNISKSTLDIPNTIEISMDTTDFEFGNIATFVTPKILEDSDLKMFDELDNIYDKVNTLQTSSKQLEDGANTLKNGTSTFSKKSKEFNNAMKEVSNGVNELSQNYSKIDNGINTLNQNSEILAEGAKQISEGTTAISTNLKTISKGLGDLQAGTKRLQAGQKELNSGFNSLISSLGITANGLDPSAINKVASELQSVIKSNLKSIKDLTDANTQLEEELNKISGETDIDNSEAIKAINSQITINTSLINSLQASNSAYTQVLQNLGNINIDTTKELLAGIDKLNKGMSDLQSGTKEMLDGETELKKGADLLASKTDELATGANSLYEGTIALSDGTKTLNDGSSEMIKGLSTLNNGANSLADANDQLTEGANTLSNGAETLANGINKFNKEGIQTIYNYVNGDLKDINIRLEKLQELAEEYQSFTMLDNENQGSVKFIMIMDSIKKED